jgi:hypothetical protein
MALLYAGVIGVSFALLFAVILAFHASPDRRQRR